MTNFRFFIGPVFLIIIFAWGCQKNESAVPVFGSFKEELDYIVDQYVEVGASIGIIETNHQVSSYYYGVRSLTDTTPPNGHTVYEIGSITKSFTATLFADMLLRDLVELEDTLGIYLPWDKVRVPTKNDIKITLKHLATHSSGLPKSPQDSNYPKPPGYDPYNPYAAYQTNHVYEYLGDFCYLLHEPGTRYHYSNTGMGLLGHILGIAAGSTYKALVHAEVFEVLGMESTTLFLSPEQIINLAPGYNESLDSVKNYNATDIFQGAGFIKSTLNDMIIYLKANMGLVNTPLEDAMIFAQQSHFNVGQVTYNDRTGQYELSIGLAWHIEKSETGQTIIYHGGRTMGYMAYIGMDPISGTGAIILCNVSKANQIITFGEKVMQAIIRYS